MIYYSFDHPQRIRAGYVGDGENKKPFYFHCADCEKPDAVIHGMLASGVEWKDIAIINKPKGGFPAYFCETCFYDRITRLANHGRPLPPNTEHAVPQLSIPQ